MFPFNFTLGCDINKAMITIEQIEEAIEKLKIEYGFTDSDHVEIVDIPMYGLCVCGIRSNGEIVRIEIC